ncbi:MAG: hydantoinase B/oxoprolinase family protein [Gemmatimonadota bacterium]|uniref:hydantoinase B/oxoprolinase family protein n=1 Tax=Candidatus Palauibacter scopulicola TaxID=3056741 RepID=UPI002387F25B|nr:hydantoinase B/oxoprolinase family protein [Candidatus Palauibacter scopulicola]MDE2664303.1 hydantoinase B/oxoprolinase family protein [Candidatus Palauibacter scopulicola]
MGGPVPDARLAIDIGGTFTDVALETGGRLVTTKVLTTAAAPERGVLEGVHKVLGLADVPPSAVRLVIHGTTLATNAVIERRGARTALIVTSGHRDALEMAHENRFEQYDIGVDRPAPLVPRRLRLPVEERVDHRGRVLIPLEEDSVRALLPTLEAEEVESVAVGLIHGYANPAHERRIGEILDAWRPGLPVTLASDVCPEVREYERQSTACANAYVQPLMARYLTGLAASLRESGLACPFLLMTSGGGLTTLETAVAAPVRLVESGPAGGAILASHLARSLDLGDVLSFDMGGTTAKLCVIDGGRPLHSRTFEVARSYRFKQGSGLPVRIPVIEMVEIGAGGGSIAGVDDLERIQVGPGSAGSEPGPAAYGRGGDEPTVTDADVVLGRIDPQLFAGGSISLDRGRAAAAIESRVGRELGLDARLAALGISEMVDENMSNAARTHAIEWGKGVAGRTLIAFGGSAPIHAARLADKLEVDRFLVPADAGVGSAVGFLLAPISYEVVRSRYMRLSGFDPAVVREVFDEMRDEAEAVVSRGAPGAATSEKARAYMRYVGQGHEIGVDLPGDLDDAAELRDAFDRSYETVYGRTIPGLDIEVLSWTLVVSAPAAEGAAKATDVPAGTSPRDRTPPVGQLAEADVPAGTSAKGRAAAGEPEPERRTELWDGTGAESMTAAVHTRAALAEGIRVGGPALIAEDQTTTVVPDGWAARAVAGGHLLVERRAAERGAAERAAGAGGVAGAAGTGAPTGIAALEGQIMWSRLLSVVEEQARTLVRTAFSTPVREAGDLSAGVFDLSGRMLAQAVTGTPGHVNAMAASVGFFLRDFPVDTLHEDDVLVTNDPWEGTGHLNDFTVVTPTFLDGRPVALFAATSHIADVGGRGFGADANQVFEEGIRLPIGYLIRGGRVDETLMRLVRANVRDPDVAQGDLYSLAACNRTGCERLVAMMSEFGIDSLEPLAETIISTSRRAMRERIGALRPGTYRNRMRIDGYDEDLDLVCALTVLPDGTITIDWDGTSPMSSRGINVPVTYTRAYSSFGVRCIVGSEVPNNAGSLAAIEVSAPPGSLLNAPPPAAVSARHAIGQMLPDVVLGCLEQALEPGAVPAEGASCLWNPVIMAGPGLTGAYRYGGAEFVVNPFHAGGTGARPGKDGLSATAFPSGVRSTPIEITETVAPLIFWRKEYLPDSGGPGEFRGGLGQVMEISHADGEAFAVSKMFERVRNPARGRDGGGDGAAGRVHVPGVGEFRPKGREIVPPGRRIVLETPGGGGLGDAARRPPDRVREDILDGYVSPDRAAGARGGGE